MYFIDGINPNEIGDFEVVAHEGQLHAFYLALPSHDAIGHLVSDDGINWDPLPPALRTGAPGAFDGDQIWTMGVFKKDRTWFMLYTGNERRGCIQRIGLATSPDLMTWARYAENPVAAPDPRWYEAEQTGNYRVDWRDPHIVERDGVLHAFLCARENTGLLNRRGCAAHLTSVDGYRWEVRPPACAPRNAYDFECPSVFELNGKFYMVAILGGHNRMVYRIADRVEGPYLRPPDDSLTPGLNMSVRPCLWRGRLHLFHWGRGQRDWSTWQPSYATLASPKLARVDAVGDLIVESFDWSPLHRGDRAALSPRSGGRASCGRWEWQGNDLVGTSETGGGIYLTDADYEDFELTAEVELDRGHPACEFGLTIRTDETGDQGIFATCVPGRCTVELVKLIHNHRRGPESLWRGRSVLQTFHLPPVPDGRYSLRLIAFGPSVEVNVNGRLVLHHLTLPRRRGRLGVFVEDGGGRFRNVTVQPVQAPACNWEG